MPLEQPAEGAGLESGGARRPAILEDGISPLRKGLTCRIREDIPTLSESVAQTSPLLAEFVGSMLQALTWNCMSLGKESAGAGQYEPLCIGLVLMVSTYSFAGVSGAHLNPAVSLSVGLSNIGEWCKLGKYMLAQFLGSLAGVALSCGTYQRTAVQAIGPRPGFHLSACFFVEMFYTGMISLVYLNVTLSRSNNSVKAGNQFYGLAIGLAMAAGCWASEDISGAIFNPALSLAVDFQNVSDGVGYGFFYILAQVLGSFLASITYRVIRPHEDVEDHELFCASRVTKHDQITMPKLVAEGIGTWLVVFTFGLATLSKQYHRDRPFAAGAALMSMHYALSDVSGGHFNPAVTLSVLLNGRGMCSVRQGMAFMVVQIVCAALGAFFFTAIYYPRTFPCIPKESLIKYGWLPLTAVDIIYSFLVCYVALATITVVGVKAHVKHAYYDGLAYGLASAAGGFAMLHLLNSLANPALTLGEALAHIIAGEGNFHDALFVSLAQFGGAVLASCLFRCTHASLFRRELLMGESEPLVDKFGKQAFEGVANAQPQLRIGDPLPSEK